MGNLFSGFTAAGIVTQAGTFASEIVGPALVVVGLAVATGLTAWVVRLMRTR